jgi:hypothetical protein
VTTELAILRRIADAAQAEESARVRLMRGTIRAGTQLVKDYDAAREALVAALEARGGGA